MTFYSKQKLFKFSLNEISQKFALLTSAVFTSICLPITANATENIDYISVGSTQVPLMRYAIKEGDKFLNRETFTCFFSGAGFCDAINTKRLTLKEQSYLNQNSDVMGEIFFVNKNIEKSTPEVDAYNTQISFYVGRTCDIVAASNGTDNSINESSGDSNKSLGLCFYNKIQKEFYCNLESDLLDDSFIVKSSIIVNKDGSISFKLNNLGNEIAKLAKINEEYDESYQGHIKNCFSALDNIKLYPESQTQYEENLVISAKLQFVKSDSELSSLWNSFSHETKQTLLPSQRVWIKSKNKKCGKIEDKHEGLKAVAVYNCQADETQERISELQQNVMQ